MTDERIARRLDGFFRTIDEDLEAAEVLIPLGNRLAAFHLQQATEKLTKAALIALGIEGGIEHRLDALLLRLPEDNAVRARLWSLRTYAAFATAFRYPTPGGRLVEPPSKAQMLDDLIALRKHVADSREELLPRKRE